MTLDGLTFYVGTALSNAPMARAISARLEEYGARNLYKWFDEPLVEFDDHEAHRERAQAEINACTDADFGIIILHGGRGTHTELGALIATGSKVFLWVPADHAGRRDALLMPPNASGEDGYPCVFHMHESVEMVIGSGGKGQHNILAAVHQWVDDGEVLLNLPTPATSETA